MKFLFCICILLFSLKSNSQTEDPVDTTHIRTLFPQKHGNKKWKFIISLDAKRSFYAGHPVKFNGLRFGAAFNGVHRFGMGIYGLNKNAEFSDIDVQKPDAPEDGAVKFNVTYSSLFYERVF